MVIGVKGVVKLMAFDWHLVGSVPRRNGIPQTGVSVPEVMPALRSNTERLVWGRGHDDALIEIDHKVPKFNLIHNVTHGGGCLEEKTSSQSARYHRPFYRTYRR